MKNKVLVEILVPSIEEKYDVYLPINKKVGNVINLIMNAIIESSNGVFTSSNTVCLYNSVTGDKYDMDKLVYDTDIRNGSILVLM